jgi:hypothetical protein
MAQWLILLIALLILNGLWFSPRFLFLIPLKQSKSLPYSVLEIVLWYFLLGALARYAEYQTMGNLSHQGWEFYAITACLTLVIASPGFVVRTLWK